MEIFQLFVGLALIAAGVFAITQHRYEPDNNGIIFPAVGWFAMILPACIMFNLKQGHDAINLLYVFAGITLYEVIGFIVYWFDYKKNLKHLLENADTHVEGTSGVIARYLGGIPTSSAELFKSVVKIENFDSSWHRTYLLWLQGRHDEQLRSAEAFVAWPIVLLRKIK